MVNYMGQRDPTTRRLLEEILAKEEEHAENLSSMLHAVTLAGRAAQPAREKQLAEDAFGENYAGRRVTPNG